MRINQETFKTLCLHYGIKFSNRALYALFDYYEQDELFDIDEIKRWIEYDSLDSYNDDHFIQIKNLDNLDCCIDLGIGFMVRGD